MMRSGPSHRREPGAARTTTRESSAGSAAGGRLSRPARALPGGLDIGKLLSGSAILLVLGGIGALGAGGAGAAEAARAQRVQVASPTAAVATAPAGVQPSLALQPVLPPAPPLGDTARALHLLNRATYGVRPQDLEEVLRIGATAWLERQLHPERIEDGAVEQRAARYDVARLTPSQLYTAYPPPNVARALVTGTTPGNGNPPLNPAQITPEQRQQIQAMNPSRITEGLVGAKLERAVFSERQLEEVMTDFWFNHFNVFANKNEVRYTVADYERNAIRKNVFGRFEDMLVATAGHPAMLVYLDNFMSSAAADAPRAGRAPGQPVRPGGAVRPGVGSPVGPRGAPSPGTGLPGQRGRGGMLPGQPGTLVPGIARGAMPPAGAGQSPAGAAQLQQQRQNMGLNENYARELLELHTIGVDAGYTQDDVIGVARAFTGWTITRPRPAALLAGNLAGMPGNARRPVASETEIAFLFRPELHDAGEKLVLGHTLRAGRGMEDGLEVLRILARHPATAEFIATKLVRHFVADEPPAALIEEIAAVFRETDGDLRQVTRALFTSETFYDPAYFRGKVKRPFEFTVSALRATGADLLQPQALVMQLRNFGHLPYSQSAPTGYPTTLEDWVSAGAMLGRMNFALDLAAGRVRGLQLQPQSFFPPAIVAGQRRAAAAAQARGRDPAAPAMVGAGDELRELASATLQRLLPGVSTNELADVIVEDLLALAPTSPPRTLATRAVGLALGSPEFQRH